MYLTLNMYKIITLQTNTKKFMSLENVFDTTYVQNLYFEGKYSGNRYFKMLLMPNMYKFDCFAGKC